MVGDDSRVFDRIGWWLFFFWCVFLCFFKNPCAFGMPAGPTYTHTTNPTKPTQQIKDHYAEFDTICDATQERQDAITELIEEKLDMVLIVGGFDSSNTASDDCCVCVLAPPPFSANEKSTHTLSRN